MSSILDLPSHYWNVKLLPEEVENIIKYGDARNDNGINNGWHSKATSQLSTDHIIGLAGEYAVSLVTGKKITSILSNDVNDLRSGDVGDLEVKTRKEPDPRLWDLAVNEDQLKLDRIYILCLGFLFPEYISVAGWAYGSDIKSDHIRRAHKVNGHAVLFYNRSKLRKISDLLGVIRR